VSALDRVFLTTAQAAEQLGVEPATVRDWARRGLLEPAGGTSRRPLWRGSDLLAAAKARKPRRADLQRPA
jgi:DNA-binding transcriptional MerR regulator